MSVLKKATSLFLAVTVFVLSVQFLNISVLASEMITPISTYEELINIKNNMSGSYQLTEDITVPAGTLTQPIGSAQDPFKGVLDGNGHRILNLRFSPSAGTSAYLGLFAYSSGEIKNLALCGVSNQPTINCDYLYSGTIAAVNLSAGKIINCFVSGDILVSAGVKNYAYIGGFTAKNSGTNMQNDISRLNINYSADSAVAAGGIAAQNNGSKIWQCGNNGDITANTDGECSIGGITAIIENSGARVQDCYNRGKIDYTYFDSCESISLGGIVGKVFSTATNAVVSMTYSAGAITHKAPSGMSLNGRTYLFGAVAGGGIFSTDSHDNYYLQAVYQKGITEQTLGENLSTTKATKDEIRAYAFSPLRWYTPENDEYLPELLTNFNWDIEHLELEALYNRALDEKYGAVPFGYEAQVTTITCDGTKFQTTDTVALNDISKINENNITVKYKWATDNLAIIVYIPADANRDLHNSVSDIVFMRQTILNESQLTPAQLVSAELDNNEGITVTDVIAAIDIILNK